MDESKAKGYLVAAAVAPGAELRSLRSGLGALVLPGQRSLHMKSEKDSHRRKIVDTIAGFEAAGLHVVIYDAGRTGTERERRGRCLAALVEDAGQHDRSRIVLDLDESLLSWDRQRLIELTREGRLKGRVVYEHVNRHTELLLAIPGAVAWCWANGGEWRQRVRPVVSGIRTV